MGRIDVMVFVLKLVKTIHQKKKSYSKLFCLKWVRIFVFILAGIDRGMVDGLGVEATLVVCLLPCQLLETVVG